MTNRIDNIPNRGCPPTVLRRRHWRGGKRVRKETIANPACDPDWLVEGIRSLVKAGTYQAKDGEPPGVSSSAGPFRTATPPRSSEP